MRTVASIVLLVGVVLQLLLGGVYILSARYEPVPLAAGAAGPADHEPGPAPGRQLALGVTALGAGACGLVAALLARQRRRSRLAALLCGASALLTLGLVLLDGAITVAVIALCLVALALGGLLLSQRTRAADAAHSSTTTEA